MKENYRKIAWKKSAPFFIVHAIGLIGPFVVGISWTSVVVCLLLYYVRMFFITGFYHRYFSHRTFRTSRWFQFAMAFAGTTAAQKGPLWWSAWHREHHKYSDTLEDVHSAKQHGLWWSHAGWILCDKYHHTKKKFVGDFKRFPELWWLEEHYLIAPVSLGMACFVFGAFMYDVWWQGALEMLVVGFFLSTVLLYNGTFAINSLAHKVGMKRPDGDDESRNSWILNLITLGEGWHANHHRYPNSEAQAITPVEKMTDFTHWILMALHFIGLIRINMQNMQHRIPIGSA